MPRDGSGASDNATEAGHNIIHGAGAEETSHVARADKTATPPPEEKGAGIATHGDGGNPVTGGDPGAAVQSKEQK